MSRLLSASFSLLVILVLAAPNTVFATDPEKDPDQIGNRNVSGKVNFYSLEKEMALGKGLAREGYRVTVATHDDYASFVTEHGLGFRPIGGSFKKVVEINPKNMDAVRELRVYEMRIRRNSISMKAVR